MAGLSCKHTQMMAKVTLKSVPDKPGIAAEVFAALAERGVLAELLATIPTGRHKGDIAFAVPQQELPAVQDALAAVKKAVGFKSIDSDDGVSVISVHGGALSADPATASRVLKALAGAGVNLQMINQSLNQLSFMVNRAQLRQALAVLKDSCGAEE
ncbi:MAG TPA: ACT domain-containing protein [Candidatus Edwardsbacteria bacterium]|nr:ACT domain-containing protein [Candidatus Edwardsbacteria bacterium]